jgi:hypothetical protein
MMEQTLQEINGKDVTLRRFLDAESLAGSIDAAMRDSATKKVTVRRVGRNNPCPCGSGEKFKKCCLWKVNCGVEIVTKERGEE